MKATKAISVLFVLNVFFFLHVIGGPVELKTARKIAINLYSEKSGINSKDLKLAETFIEKENSENLFYIFNFIHPKKGFVIVSAQDATIPILGYSFGNIFESINHPIQFDEMLSSYQKQIIFAIENNAYPTTKITAEWERLSIRTIIL